MQGLDEGGWRISQRRRAHDRKKIGLEGIPVDFAQTAYPDLDRTTRHVESQAVVQLDAQRIGQAGFKRNLEAVILQPTPLGDHVARSEEHTSELQSLMRISYAVFCLNKKNN